MKHAPCRNCRRKIIAGSRRCPFCGQRSPHAKRSSAVKAAKGSKRKRKSKPAEEGELTPAILEEDLRRLDELNEELARENERRQRRLGVADESSVPAKALGRTVARCTRCEKLVAAKSPTCPHCDTRLSWSTDGERTSCRAVHTRCTACNNPNYWDEEVVDHDMRIFKFPLNTWLNQPLYRVSDHSKTRSGCPPQRCRRCGAALETASCGTAVLLALLLPVFAAALLLVA